MSQSSWLQGWLDITYLDPKGGSWLSRGNKGTLFCSRMMSQPSHGCCQPLRRAGAAVPEVLHSGSCILHKEHLCAHYLHPQPSCAVALQRSGHVASLCVGYMYT